MPKLFKESPVFGGQHRLDQMVGQLVDGGGIFMDDAAMADLVAVAIKESDGEIVAFAPIAEGFFKGRQGQRQHQHRTGNADIHRFAGKFKERLERTTGAKAAKEDGDVFPALASRKPKIPDRGVDPGINSEQNIGPFARSILGIKRVLQRQKLQFRLGWRSGHEARAK